MEEKERRIKSFVQERTWIFTYSFVLAYMGFGIGLILGMSAFSFVIFNGMWTFIMIAFVLDTKATILRIFNDRE